MKTAIKVINDRINILQQFIEKNKESKEPGVKVHRDSAVSVMLLFSQLQDAIDEHSRLTNAGQVNEELVDTIKELLSQTMVPLIERNKQIIASYNDMLGVLMDKRNKLSVGQVGSTPELDDVSTTISLYETSKTSTIDFLSEYEVAFEEIKEMLISDEVKSAIDMATQETHQEIYEDLKSTLIIEQPPLREQNVSEEESVSASIPQEEEREEQIAEEITEDSLENHKEPKIYDANSNENSNENDEVN